MTITTKPAPGRTQDADLTERILEATEQHLRAHGFSGLRVEQVAQTVGCGKTAIYRRWPTKEELAAAVVTHQADPGVEPDTGSLVEDLVIHQEQSMIHQSYEQGLRGERPIWGILIEPGVRDIVDEQFIAARRERGRTIVARAVSRGEVPPETDADALLDMIAGFSFYRTNVRDERLTLASFRQVASTVAGAPPLRIIT
ncbi:TetR family transcriptional regulator [Leucobacter luti]|uniref:TetR family transcriptional regulator n=1 Tax=Leucobacter luti TaxID=340320 RepID=A0A4R6S112_9MICO|nr:TetR/AcrR family transcriptional regulator [Leucobacter luti]MCW2289392.1 AcrR family transcriptional regulator [Leucobacter luti]TCK39952.1 TetR family transcriptional regulator [Leucobacter luti]TDP93191.1 TetR family transcriptional regulator [Leucobacter luti]